MRSFDGNIEWMAAFSLRHAAPADMDALNDIFRRSSLSNDGDRGNLLDHPDALDFSDVAVKEGRTRVATTADGAIVGFATFIAIEGALELEDLFVDPEWVRQGAARQLVLDVVSMARGHGARRVEVTANGHALGFYEKAGFVFDHTVETRFGSGERMHLDI